MFKPMNFARLVLAACAVCKKPFSGFLSSGVKCQGSQCIDVVLVTNGYNKCGWINV